MMCRDLSDELFYFDLRKEQELQQVFIEFAASQLARHEKVGERVIWHVCCVYSALWLSPSIVARQVVCHAVLA